MEESALVAAAKASPDAFAALYDRTQPEVYRFAYSLAGNHAGAEDLTAEAYRRALIHLPKYEDRGKPFARKAGREVPLMDHDRPIDDWPGMEAVRSEQRCLVQAAVARLPEVQRQVVVLRFGHERSCREIADQLGKTEAAVKQLTYRAVNRLRDILVEAGYEHDG
ncbi:MAG: sigma-70 family RNA polymerase sigma factor [Dehalococcoidia bacterium]|nr:sigma-70 family RNA polymerase sigma factor [Dehalococcoidia bacterium]